MKGHFHHDVFINTNGVLLDESRCVALIESGLEWIIACCQDFNITLERGKGGGALAE